MKSIENNFLEDYDDNIVNIENENLKNTSESKKKKRNNKESHKNIIPHNQIINKGELKKENLTEKKRKSGKKKEINNKKDTEKSVNKIENYFPQNEDLINDLFFEYERMQGNEKNNNLNLEFDKIENENVLLQISSNNASLNSNQNIINDNNSNSNINNNSNFHINNNNSNSQINNNNSNSQVNNNIIIELDESNECNTNTIYIGNFSNVLDDKKP